VTGASCAPFQQTEAIETCLSRLAGAVDTLPLTARGLATTGMTDTLIGVITTDGPLLGNVTQNCGGFARVMSYLTFLLWLTADSQSAQRFEFNVALWRENHESRRVRRLAVESDFSPEKS